MWELYVNYSVEFKDEWPFVASFEHFRWRNFRILYSYTCTIERAEFLILKTKCVHLRNISLSLSLLREKDIKFAITHAVMKILAVSKRRGGEKKKKIGSAYIVNKYQSVVQWIYTDSRWKPDKASRIDRAVKSQTTAIIIGSFGCRR